MLRRVRRLKHFAKPELEGGQHVAAERMPPGIDFRRLVDCRVLDGYFGRGVNDSHEPTAAVEVSADLLVDFFGCIAFGEHFHR